MEERRRFFDAGDPWLGFFASAGESVPLKLGILLLFLTVRSGEEFELVEGPSCMMRDTRLVFEIFADVSFDLVSCAMEKGYFMQKKGVTRQVTVKRECLYMTDYP